jgi:hypothetical protein
MCSSPRAGEIKNHKPSADGNTKKKKLFLLVHGTQCVGELSNRFKFNSIFTIFHPQTCFVVNERGRRHALTRRRRLRS